MNVTVYLGSSEGGDKTLREDVQRLGRWIGENGHTLIYGGSKIGLMGVLAESVVTSGGEAIGVEPQFFVDKVLQYDGLTELIVTDDMSERKQIMVDLGDAYVALPGGTGTLEEIAEIMSKLSLSHLDAPCILYNYKGYYDNLRAQLDKMVREGFSTEERLQGIYFATGLDEVIAILSKSAEFLE